MALQGTPIYISLKNHLGIRLKWHLHIILNIHLWLNIISNDIIWLIIMIFGSTNSTSYKLESMCSIRVLDPPALKLTWINLPALIYKWLSPSSSSSPPELSATGLSLNPCMILSFIPLFTKQKKTKRTIWSHP